MKYFIVISIFLLLSGCADHVTFQEAVDIEPVGFWYGFWHGLIFPFAWIGSLFLEDIAVYAIYNNGGWYDFGFMLGVGGITTGTLKS